MSTVGTVIEFDDVSFVYQAGTVIKQQALTDVALEVESGEFIGIIGPTGSGKSTLVQHMNGLLLPTRGRVLVEGKETGKAVSGHSLRQAVGLVFQFPENQLFAETVFDDVAFGPRNTGVVESDLPARVRWALDQVGLGFEAVAERSPFSLSGGEMRRVAIAGVLAMKPKVLVLDEPTSNLDRRGRSELLEHLQALHRQGMTVIAVTHDMNEVAPLADRLVVLNEGRVIADGPPAEVFANARMLEEIGMEIPEITRILLAARAAGLDVRTDLYTVDAAAREMAAVCQGGAGGGD